MSYPLPSFQIRVLFISISYLNAMFIISNNILNNRDESRKMSCAWFIQKTSVIFHWVQLILWVCSSQLKLFEEIVFYLHFVECYFYNECQIQPNAFFFLHKLHDHMIFTFPCVHWCNGLIDLHILNSALHSWGDWTWPWCMIFCIYLFSFLAFC